MKKLLLFAILFFALTTFVNAQTFSGTTGSITDNNPGWDSFTASASSLPSSTSSTFGVEYVTVDITHTWDSDLSFEIESPNGTRITLSSGNGGDGDNYQTTVFRMDAASSITSGSAPFNGSYIPEGYLGDFQDGQNPNGTWTLYIKDNYGGDVGTLNSWSITFSSSPALPCISDCSDATVIASLPYSLSGQTTCDDCVAFDHTDGCGSEFMDGKDEVYEYTPSSDGWVNIQITTAENDGGHERSAAVFLLDDCPSAGGVMCLASSTVQYPSHHGSPHIIADLTAGITYYIVVSNGPGVYNADPCINYDIAVTNISQPTPTAEDCFGAQPICGSGWHENTPGNGQGGFPSEVNSATSCLEGERNGNWYSFTVESSGTIQILIDPDYAGTNGDPNDNADDYDFALYNVTNTGCEGIFDGSSPQAACNYDNVLDGEDGNTGVNSAQSGSNNSFENDVNVVTGESYMLYISQWSVSTNGFTITLGGTADYIDDDGPELTSVDQPLCGDNTITVHFSESIDCSEIDVPDFNLTNPSGLTVTGATSPICDAGGSFTDEVILTLSGAITDAGTYTVSLVDGAIADVCGHTNPVGSPTVQFTIVTPNTNISGDNSVCANDLGDIYSTTNNSGNTYSWTTSSGTINGPSTNNSVTIDWGAATTATISVTETISATGCATTDTYSVTINTLPIATAGGNDICIGDNLSLTSGPNGMSNYSWDGPNSYTSSSQNPTVSASATSAMSGTYNITVTDANSCTGTSSVTINVNPNPTPTITGNNSVCASSTETYSVTNVGGNSYTWTVTGGTITSGAGTNSITVDWGTGANGTVSVTETVTATGCDETDTENITINPLPNVVANTNDADSAVCFGDSLFVYGSGTADNYSWDSATDNAYFVPASTSDYIVTGTVSTTGCQFTDTITITVNPLPSIDNITVTNVTNCPNPDGSIDITVSGGTPGYQYSIDAGNTLAGTSLFQNLNGGFYSIYVEDANACTDTSSTTIVNPSAPAIDSVFVIDVLCNGNNTGGIIIYSAGAVSYSVDNGTTTQADSSFTGLNAGNYTIWISDAGSCVTVGNATINEPTAIELDSIVSAAICGNTGSAQIVATGGSSPYTYLWSTSDTTETISNLAANNYTCTVTDDNACFETITVVVPNGGAIPTVISTFTNVLCYGDTNGTITSVLDNTNYPFTYTWSHDTLLNDSVANNLSAGEYYVTISDSYGCTDTDTITISEPSKALEISISNYNIPNCYNDSTASISVFADGGTPNYYYLWSNGETTQDINNIPAGTYSVTVSDANSCTNTITQAIANPSQIALSDSIYYDNYYGNIELTVFGGTPEYTFEWSNGATESEITNLYTGDYWVTVTDANGCALTNYYKVEIELVVPSVITPNNDGKNDKFRITNIASAKDVDIKMFNRWGDVIFEYSGTGIGYEDSSKQWDGTYNGKELPIGSYVYIIDLKNDENPYTGTVTIIR